MQNIIKLDSRVPCDVSDKGMKAWCVVVCILIAVILPAQGHTLESVEAWPKEVNPSAE